jgi:glycerol kinase
MRCVLALDQGTTSSRALAFDEDGRVLALAQREITQIYPQPGWVEHDPRELWATQLATATEALARAGLTARDVAAIGISNQRETTLVWDRATGEPVYNAIVWQDRRTAPLCGQLREDGLEPEFVRRTGLVLDPYFSGPKLRWILDNVEGVRERALRGELAFGTVDTWLLWQLTGGAVHATDPGNASRTLLYNLVLGDWDDELVECLQVPRSLLPRVVASSGVGGETLPELLGAPIPIAGIAGDQQAALFGQQCVMPGMAKNTYGTGCFLLMNTGPTPVASHNKLLATAAWGMADRRAFALEGSVFIAGAVVQWLRDGLRLIRESAEVESLAAGVRDNGGVYFVPAFAGLGSPHWDPHARGTIVGITGGTTAGHLARAALEAIAFQSADVVAAMKADAGIPLTELRVDGGAARNDLLMQFQADILGVPVARAAQLEATATGAAALAGIGAGLWQHGETPAARWRAERVFEPLLQRSDALALLGDWRRAVARAAEWSRER